jgi:hypothetical protein
VLYGVEMERLSGRGQLLGTDTNMLDWTLQGPDEDGNVWLHYGDTSINLGPLDPALEKIGNFLAENDYEERGAI